MNDLDFDLLKHLEMKETEGVESIPLDEFVGNSWVTGEQEKLWSKNYHENKNKIVPTKTTYKALDKMVVLVGASPAIKNQINEFKDIAEDDNFIIVSSNGAYKFLLENYIEPQYVFCVEAREHVVKDFDLQSAKTTLIAGPCVNPKVLEKWRGPVEFYMMRCGEKLTKTLAEDFNQVLDIGGGNVINTSLLWAYKYLYCRAFTITGMSLCYYDQYYYDNRTTKHVCQDIEKISGIYQAVDIKGNIVNTTPALTMYKVWFETYIRYAKDTVIINATEDGILGVYPKMVGKQGTVMQYELKFVPWINILPLKTAIEGFRLKQGEKNGAKH